jgi:transmembrane sensor
VIPLVHAAGEPLSPETEEADQSGHATKKVGRRLWTLPRTIALAASLVLTAIAATWLLLAAHGKVVATERTERRELMLSDGSIVQLEPETTLRVRFRTDERLVVLERGRALFRVAKNPRRPFLVHADGATVRAVGTAFGVEHRPAGIVVTVAEGSVAITAQGSGRESLLTPRAIATPVQLITAGEQLTVQSSGATQRVRQVDTARALAWADGRLVFENDTLADVIAEFNRYNRTRLRIADPQLAARRVSGVFEATDTETLLAFIRAGTRVAVTRKGDDEISITAVP